MGHPKLILLRHGETEWSKAKKLTGKTDVCLTEDASDYLKKVLHTHIVVTHGKRSLWHEANDLDPVALNSVAMVYVSPMRRAQETLSSLESVSRVTKEVDEVCQEWDYGDYEGKTVQEVQELSPNWSLFENGCPGGETPEDMSHRCRQLLTRITRKLENMPAESHLKNILVVSHGDFLRSFIAVALGMPVSAGSKFDMTAGSMTVLSWESYQLVLEKLNFYIHGT